MPISRSRKRRSPRPLPWQRARPQADIGLTTSCWPSSKACSNPPDYAESENQLRSGTPRHSRSSLHESRFTRHSPELGIAPKSVRIGTADLTTQAMMAEQGAESCNGHGLSAVATLQGNEQSG